MPLAHEQGGAAALPQAHTVEVEEGRLMNYPTIAVLLFLRSYSAIAVLLMASSSPTCTPTATALGIQGTIVVELAEALLPFT